MINRCESVIEDGGGQATATELASASDMLSKDAERRNSLRVRPDVLSAMVTVGGERYVVAIRDISTTGAQLVNVPHGLIINDRIALITRLDEEMVEVRCRVAYVRENPIKPVIGVEFLDVDGENTGKLLSFVCKLGIELIRR